MKKIFLLLLTLGGCFAGSFAQSPYIDRVYDFQPAPGQFVNLLPPYSEGDTKADMIDKAGAAIAHNNQIMISLGGYGGYVVFGFDHAVQNIEGKYDFRVLGNTFAAGSAGGADSRFIGSSEPGIIMVSFDENNNGQPDDTWYEIAGSEYGKAETIHNYEITYYRPDENKPRIPHPSNPYITDTTYIRWSASQYGDGYLFRNLWYNQPYYPQWLDDETLSFSGARLANNYIDESGTGKQYVQYGYAYGYADNYPNSAEQSKIDIDWAVKPNGEPAKLPAINFVKIYTAVNQNCGFLGEISTEILGAEDLHLIGDDTHSAIRNSSRLAGSQFVTILQNPVQEQLAVFAKETCSAQILDLTGKKLMTLTLHAGNNVFPCPLQPGLYLLTAKGHALKFLRK
jgi:hypothetical protein